jgi:hypothetical protein
MTDANGSATAEKPDAGIPDAAKGADDKGSPVSTSDPFSGLQDAGIRDWVGKAGIKTVEDLAVKARNAESLIGRSVQVPDDKAKPEDWEKVWGRLGRPEKADGYDFNLPEGVPKEMPYDADFANEAKGAFHQLGLTAKQAAGVHDFYVKKQGAAFAANAEGLSKRAVDATADLEKTWGPQEGDAFKGNVEMANRALEKLGILPGIKAAGLIGEVNGHSIVLDANIAKAMATVGRAMFKEDTAVGGTGGTSVDNPFKDGPTKGNQTAMALLIKNDRARAISLMREAGHKPEDWGLPP